MKKPAVSVIMAEYNTDPKHLREAIVSILNQTFKDFEFIIVDDGTRSPLEKMVAELSDERIRIIKNSRNKGFVFSLNKAIKNAKADYIVRMDTDDRALPERIEKTYNYMLSHPEYDVVGSRAFEFIDETAIHGGILGVSGEKTKRRVMRGDAMLHPTVMFRRDTIVNAGMYDDFYRSEDLALWCKLLLKGNRLYTMNEVLLEYRVNVQDYKKRTLKNRHGELKVRLLYYPKLGANVIDYLFILKTIIAGVLPVGVVKQYRRHFVLKDR